MTVFDHRRRFNALSAVIGAAAVTGLLLAGPLGAALPGTEEIAFKVFRDGEPLGHHRVAFRSEADDLHVEIDTKTDDDGVMVDNAMVVAADIEASNGVIHVIDTVVLPN